MQNRKPAVVFDLGGVLVDWNPRYLYRKLIEDEAAVERFLAEVCTPEWNLKQDAGRPFAEAVEELIVQYPDQHELIRAYHLRWEETVGGPIEGTVEILAELKRAGYMVAALSNWSAETFPVARRRFDFLNWFDVAVISGEVKMVKPDPRIFELLLERLGRRAEECVYIDDVEANVRAARELGFRAIHFTSPDRLREELKRMEILAA
jgi:2-haloacid dehalogenase